MYGIFTYIYHRNQPNVGKYTIHGSYGHGPGASPAPEPDDANERPVKDADGWEDGLCMDEWFSAPR